jgi:hypothetical protein
MTPWTCGCSPHAGKSACACKYEHAETDASRMRTHTHTHTHQMYEKAMEPDPDLQTYGPVMKDKIIKLQQRYLELCSLADSVETSYNKVVSHKHSTACTWHSSVACIHGIVGGTPTHQTRNSKPKTQNPKPKTPTLHTKSLMTSSPDQTMLALGGEHGSSAGTRGRAHNAVYPSTGVLADLIEGCSSGLRTRRTDTISASSGLAWVNEWERGCSRQGGDGEGGGSVRAGGGLQWDGMYMGSTS